MQLKNRETAVQFIKFGIVGISNTAIGLGTYYFFLYIGCHYMVANVLSWLISVFNAYFWNNRYVFKNEVAWIRSLVKTYLSYGLSFLSGCVCLYALVEWMGISDKIAPLLTLLLTIPMNFYLINFGHLDRRSAF